MFFNEGDFLLRYVVMPWYVLIVPMFYAFLVHYMGLDRKRWPFLMVSAVVFLVELLARSTVLVVTYKGFLDKSDLALYHSIEDAVTLLYSLFLFAKAARLLYAHAVENSEILTYDNLKWIKRLIAAGGAVILLGCGHCAQPVVRNL